MEKDSPPELDPKRDLFIPEDESDVNEWIYNATNYRLLDQESKELKLKLEDLVQRKNVCLNTMQACMGDFLKADFAGVNLTRFEKSGSIDYKKYLADKYPNFNEAELEAYRRSGSTQTRVTVTNNAMPKNIIDINVKKSVESVEEGRLKTTFF